MTLPKWKTIIGWASWLLKALAWSANLITAAAACFGVLYAKNQIDLAREAYDQEQERRRTEITIQYIQPLRDRDFIDALWAIDDFIKCHEASHFAVSYRRFSDITRPENLKLADPVIRDFFKVVENDNQQDYCRKKELFSAEPLAMEKALYTVYIGLEGLASCMETGVCNKDQVVEDISDEECLNIRKRNRDIPTIALRDVTPQKRLIETFDFQTALSVSNYLLLASGRSKVWQGASGNLPRLIDRFERYAFCSIDLNSNYRIQRQ
jgi:hypothetical protein